MIRAVYPIVAIIAICVLEGIALTKGINGEMFLITTTMIAGIGGYYYGKTKGETGGAANY